MVVLVPGYCVAIQPPHPPEIYSVSTAQIGLRYAVNIIFPMSISKMGIVFSCASITHNAPLQCSNLGSAYINRITPSAGEDHISRLNSEIVSIKGSPAKRAALVSPHQEEIISAQPAIK